MTHAFDGILDTIKTTVEATGLRAFRSRVHPVDERDMPCVLIYPVDEDIDWDRSTAQGTYRVAEVSMEVGDRLNSETIESDMQAHRMLIENAFTRPDVVGTVDMFLLRSEFRADAKAEIPVGTMTLTFAVHYRTLPNDTSQLS